MSKLLTTILPIVIYILAIIGWISNVVKLILAATAGADFTLLLLLRIVGIFAFPLGCIMGYF